MSVVVMKPEKFTYEKYKDILFRPITKSITVFLAGGINNNHWQDKTIEIIKDAFDKEEITVYVFVPSISDDVNDSDRWYWESELIANADIKAFYFENNGSMHPMTCFELGAIIGENYNCREILNKIVVSIESGFKLERNITENIINKVDSFNFIYYGSNYEGSIMDYASAQNFLNLNADPVSHGNKIAEYIRHKIDKSLNVSDED